MLHGLQSKPRNGGPLSADALSNFPVSIRSGQGGPAPRCIILEPVIVPLSSARRTADWRSRPAFPGEGRISPGAARLGKSRNMRQMCERYSGVRPRHRNHPARPRPPNII